MTDLGGFEPQDAREELALAIAVANGDSDLDLRIADDVLEWLNQRDIFLNDISDDAPTRFLNHLQVGVSNGITPDNVKRVLIAHWPTGVIPDLSCVAERVCVDLHRLIVATGDEQAPAVALHSQDVPQTEEPAP